MRFCFLISAFCILSASGLARTPDFDPEDVVRQVCSSRPGPSAESDAPLALTGEFLIDTSGTHGESLPAVAFDGTNFLVVWQDGRGSSGWDDIYAARVTPAGVVLDRSGIAISTAAYRQYVPAVAFDGTNFLVAWDDYRNALFRDVYGARVTPAGTVLDPDGFVISQAALNQDHPAIGFDGANSLVVWQDCRSGPGEDDIYGARVTPAGTVLDSLGLVISDAANWQEDPALAFDGRNFLVVWTDERSGCDIYGARVTQAGVVLDTAGIAISTATHDQLYAAVAFDGTNFVVAWHDYRSGGYTDVYGARVTPAGVVLDPDGFAISQAAGTQAYPALAFDGANSLMVWNDYRDNPDTSDIYGARVTPAGVVFDSGPVVRQEGRQLYSKLARGSGSQIFLVYQGWAGEVGGKTYNTQRIWGKMNPSPAVAETPKPEARMTNSGATIVRGVLFLPERTSSSPSASRLLDVSGRKVMDLAPGANDVRALAPGVYFVREGLGRTQKVVVTE